MEGTMKVAVMLGIGKMGFEERNIPKAKDDEVLVKLEYVGICGSDLHYYETGGNRRLCGGTSVCPGTRAGRNRCRSR